MDWVAGFNHQRKLGFCVGFGNLIQWWNWLWLWVGEASEKVRLMLRFGCGYGLGVGLRQELKDLVAGSLDPTLSLNGSLFH